MLFKNDYRLCTKQSLQIMRGQRKRMCLDSTEENVDLYTALYEPNPCVRDTRFQYYLVKWLDGHWSTLESLLEHTSYTVNQRKQMTVFFAERFAGLLDRVSDSTVMANLTIPDLLKVRRDILRELLGMTGKWDQHSKKLHLLMMKHEAQYKALIESYK